MATQRTERKVTTTTSGFKKKSGPKEKKWILDHRHSDHQNTLDYWAQYKRNSNAKTTLFDTNSNPNEESTNHNDVVSNSGSTVQGGG